MTKRQALDADVPRLIRIYRRSNRASRQPGQQNCVLEKKEKEILTRPREQSVAFRPFIKDSVTGRKVLFTAYLFQC